MGFSVNQMSHEVTLDLGGRSIVLKASFGRLAEFQRRIDVVGLTAALVMVQRLDGRAVHAGLIALSGASNGDALEDLCGPQHLTDAAGAIMTCLTAGMPEPAEQAEAESETGDVPAGNAEAPGG